MTYSNLGIVVITYNRSHLLDKCLSSLAGTMTKVHYPIYVVIQDATEADELVLAKFDRLIKAIIRVTSNSDDKEKLINNNRLLAWKMAFIEHEHEYVICVEDDVEISHDLIDFSEAVLKQNENERDFRGINFGSFEVGVDSNSYSKLRFGVHGPASLISRKTYKAMRPKFLRLLGGKIAWDSWIEPITKSGYMCTSNTSRYKDNGTVGTHTSLTLDKLYFSKLEASFNSTQNENHENYVHKQISHSWRKDCVSYSPKQKLIYKFKFAYIRAVQIKKMCFENRKKSD